MRNLESYQGNDFEFHKEIIDSKNNTASDPTFKTRLSSYNAQIELKFNEYRDAFSINRLNQLSAHPFSADNKADLLKLYSYKSRLIQKLKIEVTTTSTNRIISTCQNCTISEVNSLDHIIPKEEFSEFVANPKNLFPSCTKCNSYKNAIWKDAHNNPVFLNLYLDILPPEQYLFADVKIEDDVVTAKFRLDNSNNIDIGLYNLIFSHYTRLHLLKRFDENVDSVITPIESLINSFKNKLPIQEICESIFETAQQNKNHFGQNYWKSALEIALILNEDFLKRFR